MSGGVRNLRAMFENKTGDQSNSPPSRGRSPSVSVASSTSRPVSKVRASFVAVERSGEQGQLWGLRKASDVSSMADVVKENEYSVVDGPPLTTMKSTPEKSPVDGIGSILKGSSFDRTPMKEEPNKMDAIQEKDKSPRKPKAEGEQQKHQTNGIGARAANAAKKIQHKAKTATTKSSPKPIETTATAPKTDKKSPRTPTSAGVKTRGGVAKIQGVMDSAKQAEEGREATRKAATTTSVKTPTTPKSPAKPKIVNSPRPTTAPKPPAKSTKPPSLATTAPKSPAKSTTARSLATTATEASAAHHRTSTEPPKKKPTHSDRSSKLPSAVSAHTEASAAHTRPTELAPAKKAVHSDRPTRLPSAVTATTTASAAHERSFPDPQQKKPATRRQSVTHPVAPRLSSVGTQASLAKKASRASLADRPKSRTSINKPDENFLARMMRPTQSSSQRVNDKTQVSSPPRSKPVATTTSKATTRASLNGRAHHDHADKDGDYATKSANEEQPQTHSPLRKKPSILKSKPATSTGLNHHSHHDHVDKAGSYATKSPVSPAAPKQAKFTSGKSGNTQKETNMAPAASDTPATEKAETTLEVKPETAEAHSANQPEIPAENLQPASAAESSTAKAFQVQQTTVSYASQPAAADEPTEPEAIVEAAPPASPLPTPNVSEIKADEAASNPKPVVPEAAQEASSTQPALDAEDEKENQPLPTPSSELKPEKATPLSDTPQDPVTSEEPTSSTTPDAQITAV